MGFVRTACAWAGLLSVLAGSILAASSLLRTWNEHGSGPLLPRLTRAVRMMRNALGRVLPFLRRETEPVSGSFGASLKLETSVGATAVVNIPDDASVEEKMSLIIQQVGHMRDDIDTERQQRKRADAATRAAFDELDGSRRADAARLDTLAKRIAVGELRRELVALLLIALGTILLAVPTLFPASA